MSLKPTEEWQPVPLSLAPSIAAYNIWTQDTLPIEIDQATHRLNLLNSFRIPPSSNILEIGCGQGTCTVVLGAATGTSGHVDAIDPASLNYGAPYTLGQAQEHIAKGDLGGRITFWQRQLRDFLQETGDKKWDCAVLVHCIWYLDSEETLEQMLQALKGRVGKICIAEYSMQASETAAVPHLLASLAQATLAAHHPKSSANIRCLLTPPDIKRIAEQAGWKAEEEKVIVPDEKLQDGMWEVGGVKSKEFLHGVDKYVKDSKVRTLIRSQREAVLRADEQLRGGKSRTMDVWVATLV
ncbi:sam-dependent methyltransferase [Fusarium langsethiae]|uniref:Sam-dependent methyltransferase n=1 Tax=Fusarium langsethiae TaxID=179993 RepID=A0A0M9EQJ8_FUSLA|nr:sam-dependent methyltransferase [Fusarium langsethiae]